MFHITIGTAGSEPPTLEPDIQMVKAALLYADKVTLCSAHYSTWIYAFEQRDMSVEDMVKHLNEMDEMIPHMFSNKLEIAITLFQNRMARASLQSKNPTSDDLAFREGMKELGEQQFQDLKSRFPTLDLEKAHSEFDLAIKAGLLEVRRFEIMETENIGASQLRGTFNESMEKIANEFTTAIMETVSDHSTFPMFDDGPAKIVKAGVAVGELSPTMTRIGQLKQTHLAAEILRKLPLFDGASMNEVLDIRRELEKHAVRFRSALIKYAETIRNASWDEEFIAETEEIFYREIEPAVLDIEDAVKSNRSMLELTARKVLALPALGSSSLFAFVVSELSLLPSIAKMVMAAGVGVTTAVLDAYREIQKQQIALDQNQLFFYYRAGTLLQDGTYQYRD
jgi:hypothetical protein